MIAEHLGIFELTTEILMLVSKFFELQPEIVGEVCGHSFRGLSIAGGGDARRAIRKGPSPQSCGTGLGEFEDVEGCGRGPIPSALYASFFFLSK